jgi:hypothetical protein
MPEPEIYRVCYRNRRTGKVGQDSIPHTREDVQKWLDLCVRIDGKEFEFWIEPPIDDLNESSLKKGHPD